MIVVREAEEIRNWHVSTLIFTTYSINSEDLLKDKIGYSTGMNEPYFAFSAFMVLCHPSIKLTFLSKVILSNI